MPGGNKRSYELDTRLICNLLKLTKKKTKKKTKTKTKKQKQSDLTDMGT